MSRMWSKNLWMSETSSGSFHTMKQPSNSGLGSKRIEMTPFVVTRGVSTSAHLGVYSKSSTSAEMISLLVMRYP